MALLMAVTPSNRILHHVAGKATTLKNLLREHFKLGPERIEEIMPLGCIYLNKQRIFKDCPIPKGAYLRLHLAPKRFSVQNVDWKKCLVKETPDYVIIQKPFGIPTHATVDNAIENCLAQMRKVLGKDLYVTQRLDQPVGGLLLFSKTKTYQVIFNNLLRDRKVTKIYRALVEREMMQQKLVHYMEPSERSPKKLSAEPHPNWDPCELSILSCVPCFVEGRPVFELMIELHTGRTHQIRAQLSFMGCPILGDRLYGSSFREFGTEKIGLFATSLGWLKEPTVELASPFLINPSK